MCVPSVLVSLPVPDCPVSFQVGFGYKQTDEGNGQGAEVGPPRPPPRQSYLTCWGPGTPPGWEPPFPGPADPGVLSAAFPEELPADLKHRKLGEQGRWAWGGEGRGAARWASQGSSNTHRNWHLRAEDQRGKATCPRLHSYLEVELGLRKSL